MIQCPYCQQKNHDQALCCAMCGEVLVHSDLRPDKESPGLPPPAQPDEDNVLECNAIRARRFLMVLFFLLLLPLLSLALSWGNTLNLLFGVEVSINVRPLLLLAAPLYLIILYAYLMAKTGEALGLPFLPYFALSLFPFLTPYVWARIGGCSGVRPYLYLLLSLAVFALAAGFFPDWPFLLLVVIFCLLPFLIYQLLGCAIRPVTMSLGLHPNGVTGWLCLGPIFLLGLLVCDLLTSSGLAINIMGSEVVHMANLGSLFGLDFSNYSFKLLSLVYLVTTLLLWIKIIYEAIKLPLI